MKKGRQEASKLRLATIGAALALMGSAAAEPARAAVFTETVAAGSGGSFRYDFDATKPTRFVLTGDFSEAGAFVTFVSTVVFIGYIDFGDEQVMFSDRYHSFLGFDVGPKGLNVIVDVDENEDCDALLTGDICYYENFSELYIDVDNPGGELQFSGRFDAIPEPGTWSIMIAGFALAGAALRSRRPMRV